MRTLVLTGVLATLAGTAVLAQDQDGRWIRKSIRSACEWHESCQYRYKTIRHWQPYPNYREKYFNERDRENRAFEDRFCSRKGLVTVVSDKRQTVENAKGEAQKRFAGFVSYDVGAKFMNLQNARKIEWECGLTDASETWSRKAIGVITKGSKDGGELFACMLTALPCRNEKEKED